MQIATKNRVATTPTRAPNRGVNCTRTAVEDALKKFENLSAESDAEIHFQKCSQLRTFSPFTLVPYYEYV